MIVLTTNQPELTNDLADVVRLFFGMEKIAPEGDGELVLTHTFADEGEAWRQTVALAAGEKRLQREDTRPACPPDDRLRWERLRRRHAKLTLYALLREYTGIRPPWGSLTGIRPTKVARQLIEEGTAPENVAASLEAIYDVSPAKANLAADILGAQRGIWQWGDDGAYDVYIGIPFCRTRCLYCSFFSADLRKPGRVQGYVQALLAEIEALGRTMNGRSPRAIYVGGGTPTSIPLELLRAIIHATREAFPGVGELTVEAGRPDCVGPETMAMLAAEGVGRISINPQTMNDETLAVIGRGHTAADVLRAYREAREAGIREINMDLIVGLPGEGVAQMERTLAALAPLDMDNLTVHTLAIKHSSRLNERLADYPLPGDEEAARMLELCHAFARARGMEPYYMYRQKYMRGNLENVGYALPGAACVYNIDMMEETHHIVALGAGAVSKRMFYGENRHQRFPNPKSVEHYCANIDGLIERKIAFFRES